MAWWSRLFGGGNGDGRADARRKKRVKVQAAAQLQREGAVLLDVRERDEWAAGRAPKARHIPIGELEARAAREIAATATVLTICRSGGRSA